MTQLQDTSTLFERQSDAYASARPGYPDDLYATLCALIPDHQLAWDCGCGSGQASRALARYMTRIVATDVSAEQIARASPHERVTYQVAPAEHVPGLVAHSVALIIVATAAHWFDLPAFYAEATRVLRPGGVLAIWGYASHVIDEDRVDAWTRHFAREVLGPYWRTDRLGVLHEGYRGLEVPAGMHEITAQVEAAGPWSATQVMTLEHYADYLRSWSASQAYRDALGEDAVSAHMAGLRAAWGEEVTEARQVRWPLYMRVFRAG